MAQKVGLHIDEQLEHWRYVQAVCLTQGKQQGAEGKTRSGVRRAIMAHSLLTRCSPTLSTFIAIAIATTKPSQAMSRHVTSRYVTGLHFQAKSCFFVTSTMIIVIHRHLHDPHHHHHPRREKYQAALRMGAKDESGQHSNGGMIHRCTHLNRCTFRNRSPQSTHWPDFILHRVPLLDVEIIMSTAKKRSIAETVYKRS